jgi:hypothetical protein
MTQISEVQRQLNDLQAELADLRREATANVGLLATYIRIGRRAQGSFEQGEAIRRVNSPIGLLDWTPRAGSFSDPNLGQSLIDRLRQGNPVADSMGGLAALYPGTANLLAPVDDCASIVAASSSYDPLVRTIDQYGNDILAYEGNRESGTFTVNLERANNRTGASNFHSSALVAILTAAGAGSGEVRIRSWSRAGTQASAVGFQYGFLAASVVVMRIGTFSLPTASLILEIEDVTDALVIASQTLNLVPLTSGVAIPLFCATPLLSAGQRLHSFRWRVRLTATATAAQSGQIRLFEPLLANGPSPDPAAYSPPLAGYNPTAVAAFMGGSGESILRSRIQGDTFDRRQLLVEGIELLGSGAATADLRRRRTAAKTVELDDNANGPANLHLRGDEVQILGASFAVTYNGDGTVASVVRSGAQGAATTTITYAGAHVASVATVRGGKTVTVTPTYTGDQISSLARAVA